MMFYSVKAMLLQLKTYVFEKSMLFFRFFISHFSLYWKSDL